MDPSTQKPSLPFGTGHLVAYILCAVVGRQYNGWQYGLIHGFGGFAAKEVFTAVGFICYFLILAETWSAIPFSGGGYGLARAALGFYPGFLVGCTDALCYIFHTAVAAQLLGHAMCSLFDMHHKLFSLLFSLAFYALAVGLAAQKSLTALRWVYPMLAFIIVTVLLLFCFGAMAFTDFERNASMHMTPGHATPNDWFMGFTGPIKFMGCLKFVSYPYVGIRSVTLLCRVTETPKRSIVNGILIGVALVTVLNQLTVVITASLPGGIHATAESTWPMATAFGRMFGLDEFIGFRVTWALCLWGYLGRLSAYILPSGIILQSLGTTNLLPSVLAMNHTPDYSRGVLVSGVLGFAVCCVGYFYPLMNLVDIVIMWTMLSNMAALCSYYLLRTRYSSVQPTFRSRVGLWGAAYAFTVFLTIFVAVAFFQENYYPLLFVIVYFAVLTVYYFTFAAKTQTVCEEEELFLSMHVRNNNIMRKKHRAKPKPFHSVSRSGGRVGVAASPSESGSPREETQDDASITVVSRVPSDSTIGLAWEASVRRHSYLMSIEEENSRGCDSRGSLRVAS